MGTQGSGSRWRRWAFTLALLFTAIMRSAGGCAAHALAAERNSLPPAQNLDVIGQAGGAANVIAARDGYAYVGQGSRMVVYDVSDPAHPNPVHRSAPFADQIEQIILSGEYAYVATLGLHALDISNPAQPVEVGYSRFNAHSVAAQGTLAYVGSSSDGFLVLRLTAGAP